MSDSFVTPWTVACQAPLSMGFPGKNTGMGCQGISRGSPGDLPGPRIELASPASAGGFFTTEPLALKAFLAILSNFTSVESSNKN